MTAAGMAQHQKARARLPTARGKKSNRRDGVGGRADGTGQVEWRRRHEEAAAVVGAQPVRELGEPPDLAEIDAGLEEAVLMERQRRVLD